MGYGMQIPAHRDGGPKNVWDFEVYGLSKSWVMRVSTVELDRCHRESELLIGEELSRFLMKVSEMEHLNQFLIKIVIQIFMVSFCESQWKPYFEQPPPPGKHSW